MKKVINSLHIYAIFFAAIFIMASCNSKTNETTETTMDTPVNVTPQETQPNKLTDEEIASIAVTANQIDVDYAKIALEKSSNAEVKKFANTMSKDHQSVIDQAVALVTKLGVTPKNNSTSESLTSDADKVKSSFQNKTGSEFDKAYVDNEVSYHKAAIDLVENTLLKDVTNPELKALLESALPLFKEHLSHAEMLQKDMSK